MVFIEVSGHNPWSIVERCPLTRALLASWDSPLSLYRHFAPVGSQYIGATSRGRLNHYRSSGQHYPELENPL